MTNDDERTRLGKDIIKAAKNGGAETVARMVSEDPSLLGAEDKDGSQPLHCAAWKGHLEVVRVLLAAGAGVNAHNRNTHWGTTPLHAAAHGNQRAVVELLLSSGADRNAQDASGKTPMDHTKAHNATAAAKLLAIG